MFVVSLLCIALFSQAIAQAPSTTDSEDDDAFLASAEATFAAKFPLPYKILDFIRVMLGIPKEKMIKVAMKAFELVTELKEFWKLLIDMFRKESPTLRMNVSGQQQPSQNLVNAQFYYGY